MTTTDNTRKIPGNFQPSAPAVCTCGAQLEPVLVFGSLKGKGMSLNTRCIFSRPCAACGRNWRITARYYTSPDYKTTKTLLDYDLRERLAQSQQKKRTGRYAEFDTSLLPPGYVNPYDRPRPGVCFYCEKPHDRVRPDEPGSKTMICPACLACVAV
jgi:hypothetical protein